MGRSSSIDMPDWWHHEAVFRLMNTDDGPRKTDVQWKILGERLAKHVGRATPWTRSWLQRVARKEERWTVELVFAMGIEFPELPRGIFIPRDFQESTEMTQVQHKGDRRHVPDIDRKRQASQAVLVHRVVGKAKKSAG